MVYTHIRYTRAGTWNLSIFGGFPRFFPAHDFVADFWPCAWCPHILIGVLGGQLLPGDHFQQHVGVPTTSSAIWRVLKFKRGSHFQHILAHMKIGLNMRKNAVKCENSMVLALCLIIGTNFFAFEHIYVCLLWWKKFGNIATLLPPKSSIFSFDSYFFRPKWELIHISIIKGAPLKLWQHFGNICIIVAKT